MTNQFSGFNIQKKAQSVIGVSQAQWVKAVDISKLHGRQLWSDSKEFYNDLMDWRIDSVKQLRKAFKDPGASGATAAAKKATTKRKTRSKAAGATAKPGTTRSTAKATTKSSASKAAAAKSGATKSAAAKSAAKAAAAK